MMSGQDITFAKWSKKTSYANRISYANKMDAFSHWTYENSGHYLMVCELQGYHDGVKFMLTDPVSAAQTNMGKIYYGFLAGVLSIIVRVVNPAYPEGVMLAILLMNVLAPLIDYFVVAANKKRRLKRATV